MILLDTDVLIDLSRKHLAATQWAAAQVDSMAIPGFVAMELIQGAVDGLDMAQTRKFLSRFNVVWLSPSDCDAAMQTFADKRLSSGLGLLDALIGHTALALGVPLYTFNTKHFAAIAGLRTIQPYTR